MTFSLYRGPGLDRPKELTMATAMRDFWKNVVTPMLQKQNGSIADNGQLSDASAVVVSKPVFAPSAETKSAVVQRDVLSVAPGGQRGAALGEPTVKPRRTPMTKIT